MMADSGIPVNNKELMRTTVVLLFIISLLASCRSTRNIQTAITKKDTVAVVVTPEDHSHDDTVTFIRQALAGLETGKINYTTFSAKLDVDYEGGDGKKYNVNANLRMYKDSVIWISITAIFGIEGLRAYITKDSVKLLNKQDKIYTARSVAYLQEITALPLNLYRLQDILIGNPVFIDSAVSYSAAGNTVTLLSLGTWFKNLLTLNSQGKIAHSKLDDIDISRNRTCDLSYESYENKKGVDFSTKRRITVTEKSKLDIKLDFKQYEFNETLSFPFSVPKNYQSN